MAFELEPRLVPPLHRASNQRLRTFFYLRFAAGPRLDLLLVRGVAFDAELDLLEAAFAKNKFGHVAILDVAEEPVRNRSNGF